jgi:hypothetical protein
MNVEIGNEAAQFLFWEYINSNFLAVCVLKDLGLNENTLFYCLESFLTYSSPIFLRKCDKENVSNCEKVETRKYIKKKKKGM